MTQALFTAMTGLNAGTEQLTVVSDNIANMNTTAYKTSRVDFQDIWYATKTTGTNSTTVSGGTNPYQVGVGVQCSSITKNMGASSVTTTGRTEDLAIQGSGWFTVQNSDGKVLLTRDGTLSLDENGYLVTANGCKLLGMDETESLVSSIVPIRVPTSIKVVEKPTDSADLGPTKVSDLNALGASTTGIRDGFFNIKVVDANTGNLITLRTSVGTDVNEHDVDAMLQAIQDSTTTVVTDPTTNPVTTTTYSNSDYFTVSNDKGKIVFTPTARARSIAFETIPEADNGTNFLGLVGLVGAPLVGGAYSSDVINYSVDIGQVDDITSKYTQNYKSFSIGKDGLMTVKYGDGSVLSVLIDDTGKAYFSYEDSAGHIINDNPQNQGAALYVDKNVLTIANMQLQMAKVTNDNGLVAEGNNLYSKGVNSGQILYTTANTNGVGQTVSGALEASNVDLAQQFSNMILAQRLVQANSQVFSGANSILETLVYLGRG